MRFGFGLGYIGLRAAAKGLIDGFGLGVLELEGHFLEGCVLQYQIDGLPLDDLVLQRVQAAAFFDLRSARLGDWPLCSAMSWISLSKSASTAVIFSSSAIRSSMKCSFSALAVALMLF